MAFCRNPPPIWPNQLAMLCGPLLFPGHAFSFQMYWQGSALFLRSSHAQTFAWFPSTSSLDWCSSITHSSFQKVDETQRSDNRDSSLEHCAMIPSYPNVPQISVFVLLSWNGFLSLCWNMRMKSIFKTFLCTYVCICHRSLCYLSSIYLCSTIYLYHQSVINYLYLSIYLCIYQYNLPIYRYLLPINLYLTYIHHLPLPCMSTVNQLSMYVYLSIYLHHLPLSSIYLSLSLSISLPSYMNISISVL